MNECHWMGIALLAYAAFCYAEFTIHPRYRTLSPRKRRVLSSALQAFGDNRPNSKPDFSRTYLYESEDDRYIVAIQQKSMLKPQITCFFEVVDRLGMPSAFIAGGQLSWGITAEDILVEYRKGSRD